MCTSRKSEVNERRGYALVQKENSLSYSTEQKTTVLRLYSLVFLFSDFPSI
jgi:hypothetical protein